MALACLILAASGGIRVYQERQFDAAAAATAEAPFPLAELPEVLGEWQMQGPEEVLPKEQQQIAGCTDYVARTYVDRRTGVVLKALVAFGPAERVFPHTPTVCFPAIGYQAAGSVRRRSVNAGSVGTVPFDAQVYERPGGGVDDRVEAYYSFRHADRWSPQAEGTFKQFRHRPAMFKVQVQRPIGRSEVGAGDSVAEDFLAALVPELERRLAIAERRTAG